MGVLPGIWQLLEHSLPQKRPDGERPSAAYCRRGAV